MIHILTSVKTVSFLGGAVVGAVAVPILKSAPVRSAAVTVLSKGILLKNAVEAQWCNVREEAEDLCAEAKEKAQCSADIVDITEESDDGCDN